MCNRIPEKIKIAKIDGPKATNASGTCSVNAKDSKIFLNKMRNIISTGNIFGEASCWNDFIYLRALANNTVEFKKTIEEILILLVGDKSNIPRSLSI